jgi:hypothetical protein
MMALRRFRIVWAAALLAWGGLEAGTSTAAPPAGQEMPARAAALFPRSPEESATAIRAEPGFTVELFAAEPHLASPVAMAFDADGDVYVAEMLDYPIIRTPGMFGPFPEVQVRLLRTSETARVIGARLDKGEIAGLLNFIAGQPRDRAAGSLRGLAVGIRQRGVRALDIPAAGAPLATIRNARSDEAAEAAGRAAVLTGPLPLRISRCTRLLTASQTK